MTSTGRSPSKAVDRYDKVLATLDWGKNEWRDVPNKDRGVVFEDTFARGIKMLRLQAYLNVSAVPAVLF